MIRNILATEFFLVFFLFILFSRNVHSQPVLFEKPLSPRIANYDIDVRLDAENQTIHGKEKLTWHNKSDDTVRELQFHLYLNGFRNSRSTMMQEGRPEWVKELEKENGWSYSEVTRISLDSGEDLTEAVEYIHPDDDNQDDRTVLRVPLPTPIRPGASIVVNIEFMAKLPTPPFMRSGGRDEYFFVAQWFPKIGVWQDGEWNCHQYHYFTEFFADFGVYNVAITVPEKNLVGATGLEYDRKNNKDGTATHYYHAEDVHDFVWTTSPKFVEFTGRAQDVDIRVLMQKGHKSQGDRHLQAARLAVEYFQNWFGDYPFPNLTVVDPRRGARGTGGMEYPTLITAGTFKGMPKKVRPVEMVIIHEFGHNFWYHMVASNEFEHAWLDEGINTYSEIKILNDLWGKASAAEILGIELDDMQLRRYSYVNRPDYDPIERNAWEYYDRSSYSAMAYSKPALMLLTLDNYLGWDTMQNIMRTYFNRWKFKHPKTQDFVDVANEVSGQNLDWFFDQALYSNSVLDYAVCYVSSEEIEPGKGYDYTVSIDEKDIKSGESKGEKVYLSEVHVRRAGGFKFPVVTEIEFENGERIRENWDGKEYWIKYEYKEPLKLVSARIDPDEKVPMDINWKNNSKTVKQQKREEKKRGNAYIDMIKFMLDPGL
jgi:hypothetical protein